MDKVIKKEIIIKNQKHKTDTGSDYVQAALLTKCIEMLSKHLKNNLKDIVCRRILLKKVAKLKKIKKRLSNNIE